MKILITGGAGYVGSACLRYVAEKGHDVMAYDNLNMGHRQAVDDHPLVVGDIADTELLTQTLKDFGADADLYDAPDENPTIERSPRQCLARLDGQRQIARIDKHVRIVEFRNDTNHGHVL